MDPLLIIERYFEPGSLAHHILVTHSRAVADFALQVANRVSEQSVDRSFLEEAAMLHDVGICLVDAPNLGCHGDHPYLAHGHLGRRLLEDAGFFKHALVCERHVGVGILAQEILDNQLPLPPRDVAPQTIEEEIICYADNFFSKASPTPAVPLPIEVILKKVGSWSARSLSVFEKWHHRFGSDDSKS